VNFSKNEIVSCIVVETLSKKDNEYLKVVLDRFLSLSGGRSVFNMKYLMKCPENSVIAKVNNPENYIILYPFFSSHFSLPLKPGEHVWAFFPDGYGTNDIGYWMTRRATDHFIEDANYTFGARSAYDIYNNTQIGSDSSYYNVDGIGLPSYKKTITNSAGNTSHVFESIERVSKKPSDFLIQGSNNNHAIFTSGDEKDTGTIILTVGRGNSDETSAESVLNSADLEENNKASILSGTGKENEKEGDFDPVNDKSVILMSENPAFINTRNPNISEEDLFLERSTIFLKSDEIRRKAVELILEVSPEIDFKSDIMKIDSLDSYTLNSETVDMNSTNFTLATSGWDVNMKELFDILEEVINELFNMSTGAAPFATGVGPTGPSTNTANLGVLLSRIQAMKG